MFVGSNGRANKNLNYWSSKTSLLLRLVWYFCSLVCADLERRTETPLAMWKVYHAESLLLDSYTHGF